MKFETLQNNQREKENWSFPMLEKIYEEIEKVSISQNDRNKNGKLLAPNGKESELQNELYWKMVRTPSFKKWFGESKIIDKNGEPLVVYHATVSKIGIEGLQPQKNEVTKEDAPHQYETLYFTSEPKTGHYFAERKNKENPEKSIRMFSCFLNIKNPILVRYHTELRDLFNKQKESTLKNKYDHIENSDDIKKSGYDGIIQKSDELDFAKKIEVAKHKFNKNTGIQDFYIKGDQIVCLSQEQVLVLPNKKELDENTHQEMIIDQVKLPFSEIKNSIKTRDYNSDKLSYLDFQEKNTLFLINKINSLLSDQSLINYQKELNRMKKDLENWYSYYLGIIAYRKKDKVKLKEILEKISWGKENLKTLYDKLK